MPIKEWDHNPNQGTPDGQKLIERSLVDFGFGRPVLIDATDTAIAGNHTIRAAPDMAEEIVDVDGHDLVIHVRDDLHDGDPRVDGLMVADNVTFQRSYHLHQSRLQSDVERLALRRYFRPDEIEETARFELEVSESTWQAWKAVTGKTDVERLTSLIERAERGLSPASEPR